MESPEIIDQNNLDNADKYKFEEKIITKAGSKLQDQKSIQENRQDLQQEQQVDVKPSQINLQKLEVTVNNKIENYAGKISGVIYDGDSSELAKNTDVELYFGPISMYPVCKTKSDENGNFLIEDIPPGFYTIKAIKNKSLEAQVINIKVLPGENSYQTVYLQKSNVLSNERSMERDYDIYYDID